MDRSERRHSLSIAGPHSAKLLGTAMKKNHVAELQQHHHRASFYHVAVVVIVVCLLCQEQVSCFSIPCYVPRGIKRSLAVFMATPIKNKNVVAEEETKKKPIYHQSASAIFSKNESRVRDVQFISPLLKYGYRPAVEAYESKKESGKPLLLYLPGFDGTFLSPFLQFPELGTIFDVRCMTISTKDRSTYEELRTSVIEFVESTVSSTEETDNGIVNGGNSTGRGNWFQRFFSRGLFGRSNRPRRIYLAGESFGGILALDVTLTILGTRPEWALQGLCLINSATCYDRSRLAADGPAVSQYPSWLYTLGLVKLLSLFTDEHSFEQLLLILRGKALPSLIDDETREAYLGRVAFSLPCVIPFLDRGVLEWRLREWLEYGCYHMLTRLSGFRKFPDFRTLIVAGEKDATLPSIDEAERLASLLPPLSTLHVVDGAGHASTCGARVDLAALFRKAFPELQKRDKRYRTNMKATASSGKGAYFGMEPRYDNATVGLSPINYWNKEYYKSCEPDMYAITKSVA